MAHCDHIDTSELAQHNDISLTDFMHFIEGIILHIEYNFIEAFFQCSKYDKSVSN